MRYYNEDYVCPNTDSWDADCVGDPLRFVALHRSDCPTCGGSGRMDVDDDESEE